MSDDKKLPVEHKNPGAIQLHNNGLKAGSLVEQSLSRLNPEQAQDLAAKAADEALRLEVLQREKNINYVTGRKVVEDHIDTWGALDKSGKLTSHKVVTDVETGAGKMRIESGSGSKSVCFIATAAYGDPNHADVVFLRAFRDGVLTQSMAGRQFIRLYWIIGPGLAERIKGSTRARNVSRSAIQRLVRLLRLTTGINA